jgi:hypothetical protein
MHTLYDMRAYWILAAPVLVCSVACSTLPTTPQTPAKAPEPSLDVSAQPASQAERAAPPPLPGEYDMSFAPPAQPERAAQPEPGKQAMPTMFSQGQQKAQLFALPQKSQK